VVTPHHVVASGVPHEHPMLARCLIQPVADGWNPPRAAGSAAHHVFTASPPFDWTQSRIAFIVIWLDDFGGG
jgi:hypothetical protein